MKNLPALLRQIIVFCGVGVINTVFSLAIIIGLSECLDIHYLLANIIGYGAGLLLGFTLHKYVTFRSRTGAIGARREFFKFLVVFATGYMAQFCVLMLLVEN